mgnify:FL=1|jgi:hypothetical protein|tara:strand:+ start:416 stop:1003 length:588 start_codon:yes stop_codon:yes gene_type:complete
MNIFVLDKDPTIAAQLQCDKHVVKMIVESAQMLSTAHRMLDGIKIKKPSKSGKRMVDYYDLFEGPYNDLEAELIYMKAVHHNHPCTQWTRESAANYKWLWNHLYALCKEYTYRYDKIHKTERKQLWPLQSTPRCIPDIGQTQFRLAMKHQPQCMFPNDPVKSYKLYYQTKQDDFKMVWTGRDVPDWFVWNKQQAA